MLELRLLEGMPLVLIKTKIALSVSFAKTQFSEAMMSWFYFVDTPSMPIASKNGESAHERGLGTVRFDVVSQLSIHSLSLGALHAILLFTCEWMTD